ncbi:Peptidase M10A [Trema orientale]|uniref:Peptidase M10A n=1 Tax=Trema orientale TaxID=63057 RepID=A0A2P5BSJ1_TREOI|nr:Peptidase M10A [Trema orientale]
MAPKGIFPFSRAFWLVFVTYLLSTTPIQSDPSDRNAFDFIRSLVGAHKGHHVSGLFKLKQYLHRFGYYNNFQAPDAAAPNDSKILVNDNVFDEALESADIFLWPPPRQLWPPRQRWPKTHLTYRVDRKSVSSVPGAANISTFSARAFKKWANVTRFTFWEVPAESNSSDIFIDFYRIRDQSDLKAFDGHGGIVATAYLPTKGLFHYEAEEKWSENPKGPWEIDLLESVALHEIGHLLGLYHSFNSSTVMYPRFNYGNETKRDLQPDDIQRICDLYNLPN